MCAATDGQVETADAVPEGAARPPEHFHPEGSTKSAPVHVRLGVHSRHSRGIRGKSGPLGAVPLWNFAVGRWVVQRWRTFWAGCHCVLAPVSASSYIPSLVHTWR